MNRKDLLDAIEKRSLHRFRRTPDDAYDLQEFDDHHEFAVCARCNAQTPCLICFNIPELVLKEMADCEPDVLRVFELIEKLRKCNPNSFVADDDCQSIRNVAEDGEWVTLKRF